MHQIPKRGDHIQFQKWAEEYGPIFSLIVGSKTIVVLSSIKAIQELVEDRGSIYDDRPELFLVNKIGHGTCRAFVMIIQRGFNQRRIHAYRPLLDMETNKMLYDILTRPETFQAQFCRFSASMVTRVVYGWPVLAIHDARIRQLQAHVCVLFNTMKSVAASLLEYMPILRPALSLFPFLCQGASRVFVEEYKLMSDLYAASSKESGDGHRLEATICNDVSEAQDKGAVSPLLAAHIGGVLLQAGVETIDHTLSQFVRAMILYPHVQSQARSELDAICGSRLPTMEDYDSLVFIQCCVKESLRWFPAVPLGFPHKAGRDNEYSGYRIPKDATVILNAWAVHMGDGAFANAMAFDPSRFLNEIQAGVGAANGANLKQRNHLAFGAGRRTCPGMQFANQSLFLSMSRLLWAFDFCMATDDDGNAEEPRLEVESSGLTAVLPPFRAVIRPRSQMHADKVTAAWEGCRF
ncbi:hypothetical protein DCS_00033 [Drechmeria coniospora]|uniref:Cytochrome P450 n=1 Tax=Drechmeria coniospora TaxID=98403 RepID=A0A151GP89_DRECN|nr:hypothetical protein DCS_00033 [Drechmeria coniospora]KYK58906.1 hypothetical protein DCS_00033 [Drechmeria coniospora]